MIHADESRSGGQVDNPGPYDDLEDRARRAGLLLPDAEPVFTPAEELRSGAVGLRSHARVAHMVAAANVDRLLHVAGIGWYAWDGRRFISDVEDKLVTEAIIKCIRDLAFEALGDKELSADLTRSQSASGLAGVARAMSVLSAMRATVEDLDADPLLLNVANGVLDLRELDNADGQLVDVRQLKLHPHDPQHRMTQITRASFDPDVDPAAASPLLDGFLDKCLPDLAVRSYLQRALGIGLLGEQVAHLLPILEGAGRNGKGVLYGAAHHALGGYSHIAPSSLFDVTRDDPNRPNPAFLALRGKRLVWVSETAKTVEMDSARIKRLTGGDPITGRGLHKNDSVTFNPSHLLVLITNNAPRLPADDPAVWARVRRVPWTVVLPEDEQDPELPTKMRGAADALLTWMLQGLAEYRDQGLNEPQSVQDATNAYKADQDTVSRFVEDRCDQCDPGEGDGLKALHMEYRGFCRGNGVMAEHMLGERDFGSRLDDLGFPSTKGSGGRRFRAGLKLTSDNDLGYGASTRMALTASPASPTHLTGGLVPYLCRQHEWHEGQVCSPDWCHQGHHGSCNKEPGHGVTERTSDEQDDQ